MSGKKEKMTEGRYEQLFGTGEESLKVKAEAFDKIAEKFYDSNFGTINKNDMEVLMFSLYIERILEKDNTDFKAYSDYTLSKELGITQAKVSNLKVRKELQYPYEKFKWQDSFKLVLKNAIYENGRIKILIPDRNLYLEIKNAIEENDGFIEITLTSNLLQVRLSYFLDLLLLVDEEIDQKKVKKDLRKKILEDEGKAQAIEEGSLGEILIDKSKDAILSIIEKYIPNFGPEIQTIAEPLMGKITGKLKEKAIYRN